MIMAEDVATALVTGAEKLKNGDTPKKSSVYSWGRRKKWLAT